MANGNLDYSTIYGGLTGGGENLSSMINSLVGKLQMGGYFGESYDEPGEYQSLTEMQPSGQSLYTNPEGNIWGDMYGQEGGYNLENLMKELEKQFGDEGTYSGNNPLFTEDVQGGMGNLLELLKQISSSGIVSEYGQGVSNVGAEVESQYNLLGKKLTTGGKSDRYSSLAAGGRQRGPGRRKQYMSDYYNIMQKGSEMKTDLQEDLVGGYEDELLRYMKYTS